MADNDITLDAYPIHWDRSPSRIPVEDIVALRLFESREDKIAMGQSPYFRSHDPLRDTVFVFSNGNGDGTLISEVDTVDAAYGLANCVNAFKRANVKLVSMCNRNDEEFLVNENFVETVQPELELVA